MSNTTGASTTNSSLTKLAIKGAIWTLIGFGSSMAIRLGGNLILTRILFPEAFGIMALVSIFLVGLEMFSDIGIGQNIISSKRGDDPAFYNTAWIIQIARGVILTLAAWAIVGPFATFYGNPILNELLPVAALTLLIGGLNSTSLFTANRHLNISKIMQIEIIGQLFSLLVMIVGAWIYHSVWALVLGALVSAATKMILSHTYIPGPKNRVQWDTKFSLEILHFGKWLFLSTIAGFLVNQGDKIILGKMLDIETLGVYSIAFALGSLPYMVLTQLTMRILLPVYAKRDATDDSGFHKKIFRMRSLLTLIFMSGSFLLAFFGSMIIQFLYDERYSEAGLILSAIALAFVPKLIVGTCNVGSLAKGDTRQFAVFVISYSIIQLILMYIGGTIFGIWGIISAIPLAEFVVYPVTAWSVKKHGFWMPLHDFISVVIFILFSIFIFGFK